MIQNACLILLNEGPLGADVATLAYYSHFVPMTISLFLSGYLLVKTKFSLLSKIFFVFIAVINAWLIADLIAWTQTNYPLIQFFWSFFDYFNVIFFLFGLYFFLVLIRQKDLGISSKLLGFLLMIPPLYLVLSGESVHEFDQTWCESINSPFLTAYKNYIEAFVVFVILYLMSRSILIEKNKLTRSKTIIVGAALILFFSTFAGTDYLSVQTGIYEIGLYGLFVLPVFLGLIVYAIVKYRAFNVGVLGAQALVVTLSTLVGTQFFFIQNDTSKILNAATFLLSLVFGYFLIRGVKRDLDTRKHLEILANDLQHANTRLKELDEQKTEFISLATHQIRGPLGSIKGYASLILEGDCGPVTDPVKNSVEIMMKSAQSLIIVVNDYLDVSRIEQGRMKYDMTDFDVKEVISTVVHEVTPIFTEKDLEFAFDCDTAQTYKVHADIGKIKQVIGNLIDNSIKYTPKGGLHVSLSKNAGKILITIKDTGVGIKKEVLPLLFNKFTRAPDASKVNIMGTGLGLFVARKIVEAHKGRVWAESEGEGKGSQFNIELDEVKG